MKDAARQKIQETINAAWTSSTPCAFVYDNQPRPTDANVAWARISLRFGESTPITVGREGTRTIASLLVQVFIPENTGSAMAFKVADKLDECFRYKAATFTSDTKSCSINGDTGCTGPIPGGISSGSQLYSLQHVLRIDEHDTSV